MKPSKSPYLKNSILAIMAIIVTTACSIVESSTKLEPPTAVEASTAYYLPKGIVTISSTVKIKVISKKDSKAIESIELISQEFSHTKEIIPDTKQLYTLDYQANAFSNDVLGFKVNNKGLLESVNISAEDRTPNIVSAIAAAPSAILSPDGGEEKNNGDNTAKENKDTEETILEFTKQFIVDPADIKDYYPWLIVVSLDNNHSSKKLNASFKVELNGGNRPQTAMAAIKDFHGILTRPIEVVFFTISPMAKAFENSNTQHQFIEYLPNTNLIVKVPVKRASFVKKEQNLTFADGMLLENKITKPSEVEGFVSIPIDIAKAIVSIPAELIQFRINNTKKENELAQEINTLEKTLLEKERADLTNGLKTQKAVLDAEKDLANTKKEIEEELLLESLKRQEKILKLERTIAEMQKAINDLENQ